MNASHVFKQLMQQSDGEMGIKGVLDTPAYESQGSRERYQGRAQSAPASRPRGFDTRSALGGGVMALLMGSGPGRKLTGKALKYGLVAGLGVYAWNAWQGSELRNGRGGADDERQDDTRFDPLDTLGGERQEQRSRALLQAVIMAARAGGESDEQVRRSVTQRMHELGADDELNAWVETQLSAPLDANALAEQADSPRAAREIYLVSLAVIDEHPAANHAWLHELADALGLDRDTVAELKRRAAQAG
ncbi:tellurite resistance TerB family protein [Halomonas sp. HNIBRBA4712]|uniref:tellurite resistance TerB family protein n=1 Tax=Halomonas sp. HNIBRBA4712 TaxID=3373087 RepID=UPI0037464243